MLFPLKNLAETALWSRFLIQHNVHKSAREILASTVLVYEITSLYALQQVLESSAMNIADLTEKKKWVVSKIYLPEGSG